MSNLNNEELQQFIKALEPQKNLRNNFNIDLNKKLKEYLKQIEGIFLGFNNTDEGSNTYSFSHAALMLQNTTIVYHRKVEYLYQLAYAEMVVEKKNKSKHCVGDGIRNYEDYINREPTSIFNNGDYIEASTNIDNQTNITLSKTQLNIPDLLLPKEVEQNIYPLNNTVYDRYGNSIGNSLDFMMNQLNLSQSNFNSTMNESIGSIEVGRRDTTMIDNGIDNDFYDALGFDDYNPKEDDQNQINLTEMNNTNFEITSLSNDDILNQLLSTNSVILDPHQSIPDLESPLKEVGLKAVISDNIDDQSGKKKTKSKTNDKVYYSYSTSNKKSKKRSNFPELEPNDTIQELESKKRIDDAYIVEQYDQSFRDNYNTLFTNLDFEVDFNNEQYNDESSSFNNDNSQSHWIDNEKYNQMKPFLEEAVRFESQLECKLSRKVKHWDHHIKKILAEQNKKPAFNLSTYQNNINDWLQCDKELDLKTKFNHSDPKEISRYFLATLHMAQDSHVSIASSDSLENFVIIKQ